MGPTVLFQISENYHVSKPIANLIQTALRGLAYFILHFLSAA